MAVDGLDTWAAGYLGVRDRIAGGRSSAERTRRYRARQRGELPPYPFLEPELFANTVAAGDCLEWTRAKNAKGYGHFKENGRTVNAHRRALELVLGRPLAPGMVACHTCDNPPCIEPTHLFEGTAAENAWDRELKGRHRVAP